MNKKSPYIQKVSKQKHLIPEIADWPLYQLYSNREGFIHEINQATLAHFENHTASEMKSILDKTMYQERVRMKRKAWKVDPPNEKLFWKRIASEIEEAEKLEVEEHKKQIFSELLLRVINRFSEEIAGNFSVKTFLFARKFLTFFFGRLLNAAASKGIPRIFGTKHRLQESLPIAGHVELTRQLFDKGVVILVPTHFSNLDSILLGYVLDFMVSIPAFHYGAGLNLYNAEIAAYFMNRLGAYRLDRRKKNAIYMQTLKSMSSLSIQKGVNTIFFPGGTRSRSGHIEQQLKLGLLSTCLDAQRSLLQAGSHKKVFIVPVVLNYHFVLEAKYLVDEHLSRKGKEKYIRSKDSSNSWRSNLKFIYNLFSTESEVLTSFGPPTDVFGNEVNQSGESLNKEGKPIDISEYFMRNGLIVQDEQREFIYTRFLGEKIADSFKRYNVVLSSDLVAFTAFQLLLEKAQDSDLFSVLRSPEEDFQVEWSVFIEALQNVYHQVMELAEQDKIRIQEEFKADIADIALEGLNKIGAYHADKPLYLKSGYVYSENFKLLYYYHNRLDIYDLSLRKSAN
jgi:glycerol-3-phosphate O-acyltransferase